MTREELKSVMQEIRTAYGDRFQVTKEIVDLWERLMSDLDHVDVRRSADEWMRLSAYPPTIADIRKGVAVYEEARQSKREWVRMEYNTINYPHKDAEDEAVFYSLVYDLPEEKWVRGAQYLNWVANETVKNAVDDVPKLEDVLRKAVKK